MPHTNTYQDDPLLFSSGQGQICSVSNCFEIRPAWSWYQLPWIHITTDAGTPFDSSQKCSHIIKYPIKSMTFNFNPLSSNFPVLCLISGVWVLKVSIWPIHVSRQHIWNIWPTVSCAVLSSKTFINCIIYCHVTMFSFLKIISGTEPHHLPVDA